MYTAHTYDVNRNGGWGPGDGNTSEIAKHLMYLNEMSS